jgi:hypothetical protein
MFINARRCLLFLLPLLFIAVVSAQQIPPTQPGAGRISLDVSVDRKSGPPVRGLQRQDFTVLDNKVPQTLTSFRAVDGRQAANEVILLIDAVNTDYERVAYERNEIDKFLRAEGGHLAYPTALSVLTDTGARIQQDFSTDGQALSASLDQYTVGLRTVCRDAGFYGAAERYQISLRPARADRARGTAPGTQDHPLGFSGLAASLWPQCPDRRKGAARALRGHCQFLDSTPASPHHSVQHRSLRHGGRGRIPHLLLEGFPQRDR